MKFSFEINPPYENMTKAEVQQYVFDLIKHSQSQLLFHKMDNEADTNASEVVKNAARKIYDIDLKSIDEIFQSLKVEDDSLLKVCQEFIDKNKIYCADTICQVDRVIVNAYDFIEDVCDIVGYKDLDDE